MTHEPIERSQRLRRWQTVSALGAIATSGALLAIYAHGGWGWPLGFIALVPWFWTLQRLRSFAAVIASAALMAAVFALAALGWFGPAFGAYVGIDSVLATALFALLAPALQPQFLVFAMVWHMMRNRDGATLRALAASSAWVGCEWLLPKLLGDTLGHGLQPSQLMRQAADLGGAALLTMILLLVNAALARTLDVGRAAWRPVAVAVMFVTTLAGYGFWRLAMLQDVLSAPALSLRIGLVQANITDLEQKRAARGTHAVVQELLDTHFAMSEHAVRAQGAEAVLWSETVYPTTFGSPKSADGAAFDRRIHDFVVALGVPLVFGTYDRDDAGEYNSAAFIEPARGVLGHYRKTHLFPFTEWVPNWLDRPGLRRLLPWAGTWKPGDGARVFPLTLADGREANVVPLICLDDVRPQLAIYGARLGAQAIVGLSNDSWFTAHPAGARLHLAVASFRSIETRLPQLRATTNGLSAIIDESGEVVAQTGMGQQAVLVGEIPLRAPVPTLMVQFGDWIGRAGIAFLLALVLALWRPGRQFAWLGQGTATASAMATTAVVSPSSALAVVLLSPIWRAVAALLLLTAATCLLWLGMRMIWRDGLQVNSLAQISLFGFGVVLPMLVAWLQQRICAGEARIEGRALVLERAGERTELPLSAIVGLHVWRIGLPGAGLDIKLASGRRFVFGVQLADPAALHALLATAGSNVAWSGHASARSAAFAADRAAARHRLLDHAAIKFLLFPLLPALVAFRLHQHIAFGGTFGELQTFGPVAWFTGLLIWWAAWSLGLMLLAAILRVITEIVTTAAFLGHGSAAPATRQLFERITRVIYYLGTPVWLVVRLLWG